ncbi:hypothetical protein [Mesorhizobium sp. B2-3-5]|uniref:hypothetical protein n=1 Tax=Mesorhizobium sp. B2-3-5 TaxID=2589958 RepID=UPI0011285A99|nr:hypothetical protein [Mesorhizobium sp. B2-3-5]TPM13487.1 hypothetical protein FJ958_30950 [Mesorhizobium sp. B2-3-5]
MQEFLRLPFDTSGFGDFAASYIGSNAKVQFLYKSDGSELVGEIRFPFCISMVINGNLSSQKKLPYDTIMVTQEINNRLDDLYRYEFMLSGSDFQFAVVAKECTFSESITTGIMIDI